MSQNNWGNNWGEFDNTRPPEDPPKVIYHKHIGGTAEIPEEYRRVFGSPPPKGSKKPIPPPPPPPNSYHKKPKYWQMRYTSHQQIPNRIAGVMSVFFIGVAYLIDRYGSGTLNRWDNRVGWRMTPQEKKDYDEKNEFFWQMMTYGPPADQWATNETGERYINVRKADNKIRWDLREVDSNCVGARELHNPMDNPL